MLCRPPALCLQFCNYENLSLGQRQTTGVWTGEEAMAATARPFLGLDGAPGALRSSKVAASARSGQLAAAAPAPAAAKPATKPKRKQGRWAQGAMPEPPPATSPSSPAI